MAYKASFKKALLIFTLTLIGMGWVPNFASASVNITRDEYVFIANQHRQRVAYAMLLAYSHSKESFPDLDERLIVKYSALHDLPKIMTLEQLRVWGYQGDQDIASILAQFYGRSKNELSLREQRLLGATMTQLNLIEDKIKRFFFSHLSFFGQSRIRVLEQLSLLETYVDVTDSGLMRREELGITDPRPYNGLRYLISLGVLDMEYAWILLFTENLIVKSFPNHCTTLLERPR